MASNSKSLVLATISLHRMAGGLEKNIVRLANAMAERGHRVGLLTFDLPGSVSFFPIDSRVQWHRVGETQPHGEVSFFQRLRLIWRCRRAIAKYGDGAVVLCFHHGILVRFLLAALFLRANVFCSERNSLAHYNFIKAHRQNINFLALHFVKKIVVQFPNYVRDYPASMRDKITAIANPVLPASGLASPARPTADGRFLLLTAARLSDQKNLATLIQAFAGLAAQHPQWDLYILGEGGFRKELESLVASSGLTARVFLPGNAEDMSDWFEKSHIFCLPSKWEGFPNALAEALAAGLPAVGYAQCAGVNELIVSGKNGLLASGNGDLSSLQAALSALMADGTLRVEMGVAAKAGMEAYEPLRVFSQWERLLFKHG